MRLAVYDTVSKIPHAPAKLTSGEPSPTYRRDANPITLLGRTIVRHWRKRG